MDYNKTDRIYGELRKPYETDYKKKSRECHKSQPISDTKRKK